MKNRFEQSTETLIDRDYTKIFIDEFFREDQTKKDPEKLLKQMVKENKLTLEEANAIRGELKKIVVAHEKNSKKPNEQIGETLSDEQGSYTSPILGDLKYSQQQQSKDEFDRAIFTPETRRFADKSTMNELIDLYLKQGWDLEVITDRLEEVVVIGREGDKATVKLKDGKEVVVSIDSLVTLEEYRKNKIDNEKQDAQDAKLREEIEANKETIIDNAIDFYQKHPHEFYGSGGMFFYYLSVEGYGQVKPILRSGKKVKVRFGFSDGKNDEKTFSIDKIKIEVDDRIS